MKISKALEAKPLSDEHKAKIINSLKGRHHSDVLKLLLFATSIIHCCHPPNQLFIVDEEIYSIGVTRSRGNIGFVL